MLIEITKIFANDADDDVFMISLKVSQRWINYCKMFDAHGNALDVDFVKD